MTRGPMRRWLSLSARESIAVSLALVIGLGAVWQSIWDLYVFARCDVSVLRVHPLSFLVTVSPGAAGVLLLASCILIAFRRKLGPTLYWLAVLSATGAVLVTNYTYIGVDRPPWLFPSVRWTYPEQELGSLWRSMQAAALGTLIILGWWLTENRDGEVSTDACDKTLDANASGAA